jgi:hypothetical protein
MAFNSLPGFLGVVPEPAPRTVVQALRNSLSKIVVAAKALAPTQKIRSAIKMITPVVTNDRIVSGIEVDLVKAPEAAAFEYGSGKQATKGSKGTYPIRPKAGNRAGNNLVFDWPNEQAPGAHKHTKDGRVVLPMVNHPGVHARPYLAPAIAGGETELLDEIEKAWATSMGLESGQVTITTRIKL